MLIVPHLRLQAIIAAAAQLEILLCFKTPRPEETGRPILPDFAVFRERTETSSTSVVADRSRSKSKNFSSTSEKNGLQLRHERRCGFSPVQIGTPSQRSMKWVK